MTTLLPLLVLLLGAAIIAFPRRSKEIETRILSAMRLTSAQRAARPPTRFDLRLEQLVGVTFVVLAAHTLSAVRLSMASSTHAATTVDGAAAPYLDEIRAECQAFMAAERPAGLAVGICAATTTACLGFGEATLGSGTPPTSQTIFEIGSITKTFTGTVLAAMVCRGDLASTATTAQDIAGALSIPSSPDRPITLGDLATHTSGLPRLPAGLIFSHRIFLPGGLDDPYARYSADDLAEFLAGHELSRGPGEKWEYSNLGMGLLAYLMASHRELSVEEMYRLEITAPLAMNDTTIALPPAAKPRLAQGYSAGGAIGSLNWRHKAAFWTFQDTTAGAGALKSTVSDMLLYLRANLDPADSPLSCALTLAQEPGPVAAGKTHMGLGWLVIPTNADSTTRILHDGGTGGFSSFIILDPENQTGVVLLCNQENVPIANLAMKIMDAMRGRP